MRILKTDLSKLKNIMLIDYGLECTDEEAQKIGLAVIRMLIVKAEVKVASNSI